MPQYRVDLAGYAIILAPDKREATIVAEGITTGLSLANGELKTMSYVDWLNDCGIKTIQMGLDHSSIAEDDGKYPDTEGYIDPGGPISEE